MVGGLKGYKGGAVFQPDDKTANVENPAAIIIQQQPPEVKHKLPEHLNINQFVKATLNPFSPNFDPKKILYPPPRLLVGDDSSFKDESVDNPPISEERSLI
jgi:hypothetical protein